MSLKVVDPIEVTEAVLTASDIPEPDASVGEQAWESFEDKYEFTDAQAPSAYLLNFDMTRNNHGELMVVGADRNDLAIIKFDANGNQVFVNVIETDMPQPSTEHRFIGIAHDGDDLILYWHNNSTGQANSDKAYRQVYAGLAAQGSLPSYTVTTTELTSFPQAVKDSENTRLTESGGVLFAAYNDGYNSSSSVNLAILDKVTGEQAAIRTESLVNGGVVSIEKDGNNGVYICAIDSIIIQYSGQLERINLKTDSQVLTPFSQLGFYSGTLTTGGLARPAGNILRLVDLNQKLNLASSYSKGDRIVYLPNHTVYQCLIDGTFSNPSETATGDETAEWIEVGPSNRWAMFDGLQNTKTLSDSDFTVTLNPVTYVNTLAVLGFSGVTSIRVEVDNVGGSTIYDKTFTTSDFSAIYDHYTYVFYQIVALEKLIVEDLPPLPGTTIRVTFTGSDMQIGEIVHGFALNAGTLVAENTKSDRFRYREQKYNNFGYPVGATPIVVELNTYDVLVPKLNNPAIQKLLDSVTGKNTLWVGDIGGGQNLITYGFFERSPIPFSMPNDINYQITVRASV